MTGAAVKASAFQVLLLALLFVFTPSLFHLVLFEVFSFLNSFTLSVEITKSSSGASSMLLGVGPFLCVLGLCKVPECDIDDYFKHSMVKME